MTLREIKPAFVQVYSVDTPTPDGSVKPASNERLAEVAREVTEETGVEARAYWESM
jgi:hypothetical protein